MGEAKRRKSATAKLIAEFPHCYFCGSRRPSATREHMPPKALFDKAYRPDRLVMPACTVCNKETSTADLVASIISRWSYNTHLQSFADHRKLIAQIRIQAPELLDEWTSAERYGIESARNHLRQNGVPVPRDAGIALVGPLTVRQLNLFAHKVLVALYFEHFKQPLPLEGGVCAFWKSKEDYFAHGLPPLLLQIMPRYATLMQGQWNAREIFEYRYETNEEDGLLACLAKIRQGLFITGFAVRDVKQIPSDAADWIAPAEPSSLLRLPRFQKKN